MDYTAVSKEEIEKERSAQGPWVGEYPFEILDQAEIGEYIQYTQEKISKAGNPMIQLVMVFTHPTGHKRILRDWITSDNKVKLHDAMTACGLTYGEKVTANDFIRRRGVAILAKGKDGYNEVRGYILNGAPQAQKSSTTPSEAPKQDELEDSIPF